MKFLTALPHSFDRVRCLSRRSPILVLFVVALLPRLLLALVISIVHNGSLFADDRLYLQIIRDRAVESLELWDPYIHGLWDRSEGFLLFPTILFRLFGSHAILALCVSVLVGSLLVVVVYLLCRRITSERRAFSVSVLFAFTPSQILWSSLFLKDVYVALALACIAGVFLSWDRKSSQQPSMRVGCLHGLALITLLLFVSRIRLHTFVVACIAAGFAIFLTAKGLAPIRRLVALGMVCVLPAVSGAGIGGAHFLARLSDGMETQRELGAVGSSTALIDAAQTLGEEEDEQASPPPTSLLSSVVQPESVAPAGTLVRPESTVSKLLGEVRYIPAAIRVMLLEPLPNRLNQSRSLYLAFGEHLIWYPILALATVGLWTGRRLTLLYSLSIALLLGLVVMWGLVEGNFGTAFRHRTEFAWIFFVFAARGLDHLVPSVRHLAERYRSRNV